MKDTSCATKWQVLIRITVAALLGSMLTGCGIQWTGSVWTPERSCAPFGGTTRADGTCSYEAP
jgi:hypothetical protein